MDWKKKGKMSACRMKVVEMLKKGSKNSLVYVESISQKNPSWRKKNRGGGKKKTLKKMRKGFCVTGDLSTQKQNSLIVKNEGNQPGKRWLKERLGERVGVHR